MLNPDSSPVACQQLHWQVRKMGTLPYSPVWEDMQSFSAARKVDSEDELWLLQHNPVYTLGLNGNRKHVLDAGNIPLVHTDRGGQVTYHGPGQLVAYLLLDLARKRTGVSVLVHQIEQAVINLLSDYEVMATREKGAPGIYTAGAKIAALGLRVKRGKCYHGLALNVDMDLEPFSRINPCGYADMKVTQCRDVGIDSDLNQLAQALQTHLARALGYVSTTEHHDY